jgi:5-methylcytosine-specific restriction protein A
VKYARTLRRDERLVVGPCAFSYWRRACRACGGLSNRGETCSDACALTLSIACNPVAARRAVAARDSGICAQCGLDCADLDNRFIKLSIEQRAEVIADLRLPALTPRELSRTLWQMDHIVPVSSGGGACGLDNLRTLCVWCHKAASIAQFKSLDHSWSEERRAEHKRTQRMFAEFRKAARVRAMETTGVQ